MNDKINLDITGMSCTSCANRIETALKKDETVKDANVNFPLKKAYLTISENADINKLIKIVKNTGYEASLDKKSVKQEDDITQTIKKNYLVNGMSCSSCELTIEKSIKSIPGVISAKVNFTDKKATVQLEKSDIDFSVLFKKVKQAGYELVNIKEKEKKNRAYN